MTRSDGLEYFPSFIDIADEMNADGGKSLNTIGV